MLAELLYRLTRQKYFAFLRIRLRNGELFDRYLLAVLLKADAASVQRSKKVNVGPFDIFSWIAYSLEKKDHLVNLEQCCFNTSKLPIPLYTAWLLHSRMGHYHTDTHNLVLHFHS